MLLFDAPLQSIGVFLNEMSRKVHTVKTDKILTRGILMLGNVNLPMSVGYLDTGQVGGYKPYLEISAP